MPSKPTKKRGCIKDLDQAATVLATACRTLLDPALADGNLRDTVFARIPRLADVGGTRFWRIDADADYGELNAIARQRVSLSRIEAHWDDFLRLAGSLKLGRVPATGIMRTLQVGDRPTQLALVS